MVQLELQLLLLDWLLIVFMLLGGVLRVSKAIDSKCISHSLHFCSFFFLFFFSSFLFGFCLDSEVGWMAQSPLWKFHLIRLLQTHKWGCSQTRKWGCFWCTKTHMMIHDLTKISLWLTENWVWFLMVQCLLNSHVLYQTVVPSLLCFAVTSFCTDRSFSSSYFKFCRSVEKSKLYTMIITFFRNHSRWSRFSIFF